MVDLKQLRNSRHLTQVDVARAIGRPRPLYALMEQGKLELSPEDLEKLAVLYNVSVQYLQK